MNLRKGPKVALLPSLLCMERNTLELHFVAGTTGYPGMLGLVPAIYGVCINSIPNQGGRLSPLPDKLIPTNCFDIPAIPFSKVTWRPCTILLHQTALHCSFLDIYISRKIRLCVIDFELAKLINFLVWKFKSIIPIFLLIFEEFVKSTAFYTFLVSLVAAIPKNCYLALAKKPTNERRYLKKLECYTFYLLTRTYFRLVLSYHYCNFGEVFSLDVV